MSRPRVEPSTSRAQKHLRFDYLQTVKDELIMGVTTARKTFWTDETKAGTHCVGLIHKEALRCAAQLRHSLAGHFAEVMQ
jgi:hypothetical protein